MSFPLKIGIRYFVVAPPMLKATTLSLILFFVHSFANATNLLLANVYHNNIQISDYWVSEKLDGVRAIWDGKNLKSKQGNLFTPPAWFTAPFPNTHLDGELWIGRNQFSKVAGLVQRKKDPNKNWINIKYMIFDLPNSKQTFDKRLTEMKVITNKANAPHFQTIEQFKLKSHQALMHKLNQVVKDGGEGLMLHKADSYYKSGRSNDLLKVKKHLDAEATVIQHFSGKGKYKHMLGAILVKTEDNITFKIGSGFSDQQRKTPPPIGSKITYKYYGLTSKGKPRFASFMRIRPKNNSLSEYP